MNLFDQTLFHAINQFAGQSPIVDNIMILIAQYSLEMYALLFIIAWFTMPKRDFDNRHSLLVAGVAGVIALLLNVLIASVWYRPRPFVAAPDKTIRLIPHAADASFPSDHTSGSFAFAFSSMGKNKKWLSTSFSILAILVLISRIYCGVHYPTDVLASVVIGLVSSKIAWKLSPLLRPITTFGCNIFGYGKHLNIQSK